MAVTLPVTSSTGMFVGMKLTVGTGSASSDILPAQETVAVTAVPSATSVSVISLVTSPPAGVAGRVRAHNAGDPVLVLGSFTSGVVPPNMTNGSTGTVLKLYGDINDDGNMVYIEYTCDTTGKNLYRNVMAFNAGEQARAGGVADPAEQHPAEPWRDRVLHLSDRDRERQHLRDRRRHHAHRARRRTWIR